MKLNDIIFWIGMVISILMLGNVGYGIYSLEANQQREAIMHYYLGSMVMVAMLLLFKLRNHDGKEIN